MKSIITLLITLSSFVGFTQINDSILFDWHVSGNERLVKSEKKVNITEAHNLVNSKSDYGLILQTLIDSHQSDSHLIIHFAAGEYKFSRTIYLKSGVTIEGEGANKTKFVFNNGGAGHLFVIVAQQTNNFFELKKELYKHRKTLETKIDNKINAGDYIELLVDGAGLATSDWAMGSIGQILKIESVKSNIATLSTQLKLDYFKYTNPRIQIIKPITEVHFRFFTIERLDQSKAQTNNFYFNYAANCTVMGIESDKSNTSHVSFSKSYRCKVTDSYFHHAFEYGGNGKAYGIDLSNSSSNCLVENNILENLRHSIILQSGANGNVISGNYSLNPFWKEGMFPTNSAGELVLHGNYPFANLFEGNEVGNIVIDNSHGLNGPGNVFYRNRASGWGLLMNSNAANANHFINNEITGSLKVYTGQSNINFGNYYSEADLVEINKLQIPQSLYISAKPIWWPTQIIYPALGQPNSKQPNSIPSKYRYFYDSLRALNSSPGIFMILLTHNVKEINGAVEVELSNKLQVNVKSLKLEKTEDDGINWIPVTANFSNNFLFQDNISKANISIPKTATCYRWKASGLENQEWVGESFCFSNTISDVKDIKEETILVYPNPANDFIKINLLGPSTVKIYSMTGVAMLSEKFDSVAANLDITELASSNYIVEINDGKNITRQLFSKK